MLRAYFLHKSLSILPPDITKYLFYFADRFTNCLKVSSTSPSLLHIFFSLMVFSSSITLLLYLSIGLRYSYSSNLTITL